MKKTGIHRILTILISLVWLINGLYAKVLGFVPRHQEIVARILGSEISFVAVKVIGVLEICMFVWVISGKFSRLAAIMQIVIVITMNILEFVLVPDLLLFGRMNIIIALVFVSVVYVNEFIVKPKSA
ncbi:MAG TPA: DoxX-like family protein [Ignavibacteria bacterium]|nr:DoxX-like family protein [Ignavibacteria bacterium]